MDKDKGKEKLGKSGLFRRFMVLFQLGVVLFVVFISLMTTDATDGRSFFSKVILFFQGLFGG